MKLKIICPIIFIYILFIFCSQSADNHYKTAMEFVRDNQFNSAINELDKAIDINPNFTNAYLQRAKLRMSLTDVSADDQISSLDEAYTLAIRDYTKVLQLNPQMRIEALEGRGYAFFNLKEYQSAINDYEMILQYDSSYKQIYPFIIGCKIQLNYLDGVKNLFDGFIKTNPKDAEIYYGRAKYRLTTSRDTAGACQDLASAKRLYDPQGSYLSVTLRDDINKMIHQNCWKY